MKFLISITCALLAAACWSQRPNSDSRSNWLRECSSQRSCGEDLDCVCGVCTSPCDADATCGGDPEGTCTNPAEDIGSSCAGTSAGNTVAICLPECGDSSDCADGSRCVHGACLGEAFLHGSDDAGVPDASAIDAGSVDGRVDQGTVSPVDGGSDDAMPVTETEPPAPGCNSALRECCTRSGACEDGLVCHIDQTCIAPATPDEDGIATIATEFHPNEELLAIDADFAYGIRRSEGNESPVQLVRWPLVGGAAEMLADGAMFYPANFPLRVDGENLYFVAAESPNDLSYSLYSMPKDDSAPPTPHGTAGLHLVDDAEYVYVSNDGHSRVVRIAKSTLATTAAREQVFVSMTDAPRSIMSIAINATHVFVGETRASAEGYAIHRIDKISGMDEVLGDQTKFMLTPPFEPDYMPMLASDSYLVLVALAARRLDLASLEVKVITDSERDWMERPTLAGNDLYYRWSNPPTDEFGIELLPLDTGRRMELLGGRGFSFGTMVASPAGLYVAVDDGMQQRLVHIVR